MPAVDASDAGGGGSTTQCVVWGYELDDVVVVVAAAHQVKLGCLQAMRAVCCVRYEQGNIGGGGGPCPSTPGRSVPPPLPHTLHTPWPTSAASLRSLGTRMCVSATTKSQLCCSLSSRASRRPVATKSTYARSAGLTAASVASHSSSARPTKPTRTPPCQSRTCVGLRARGGGEKGAHVCGMRGWIDCRERRHPLLLRQAHKADTHAAVPVEDERRPEGKGWGKRSACL
eukprot:362859-Chlamydomonas_euryale.AAC.1